MKQLKNMQIIGIDNGYGNLKTASGIFPASVLTFDHEPVHAQDLLVYDGKYHVIGSGHREFTPDKVSNPDHYILTLAGIGQELWAHRMTEARVTIAAGLPLTWVESQRESFRAYLLQNDHVDFIWRGIEYHVDIVGADVYAQGFSAIVPMLRQFKGVNMLCDIGNGTMNLLRIVNRKPDPQRMFTEKYGTHQCALLIREQMMKRHHATLDDSVMTEVLRKGTADIDKAYLQTVVSAAREYTAGIFRRLREREYDPKLMKLYVVGGGGCLIRNFADCDSSRVLINEDICATAKGYEYMALMTLRRSGGAV